MFLINVFQKRSIAKMEKFQAFNMLKPKFRNVFSLFNIRNTRIYLILSESIHPPTPAWMILTQLSRV